MVRHQASGRFGLGLALASSTMLLWGVLPLVLQGVLTALDPVTITWFRFSFAALVLLLLIALGLRVLATEIAGGLGAPPDFAAFGLDVVEYEGLAWSLSEGRGYSMPDGTPGRSESP